MQTDRLLLDSLTREDAENVFSLTSDPRVARYMRFDAHTTLKQAQELIEHYRASDAGFSVRALNTGEFVGVIALVRSEENPTDYSLSLFSSPAFWNRGYSTELLECMKTYASVLGAGTLTAYIHGGNLASCRVVEKCGFTMAEKWELSEHPQGLFIYRLEL